MYRSMDREHIQILGHKLWEAWVESDCTIADAAEAAEIVPRFLRAIHAGNKSPSIPVLVRLAVFYDLSLDYLLAEVRDKVRGELPERDSTPERVTVAPLRVPLRAESETHLGEEGVRFAFDMRRKYAEI